MSRQLTDLYHSTELQARAFLSACDVAGLDVLIYCTLRTETDQAKLYREGRSLNQIRTKAHELDHDYNRPDLAQLLMDVGPQYGAHIKTNAGPGQSLHNYGFAFDGVPMVGGKPLWQFPDDARSEQLWEVYGSIGESVGLVWSGNWKGKLKEKAHLQDATADWRDLIREVEV